MGSDPDMLFEKLAQGRARLIEAGVTPADAAVDVDVYARAILGWDRATLLANQRDTSPAALEPQLFSSLKLQRSLTSWVDVVRSPVSRNQKVNAVFGALRAYDLPDLVASLPKDKITITEPQDATGQPVKSGR